MENVSQPNNIRDLSGQVTLEAHIPAFTGNYSSVYKGRIGNELVAAKVLKEIHGADIHTMQRKIQRERSTWAGLRHINVLPLYGFAEDHGLFRPFGALISPWRAQGNAQEFLRSQGKNMTPLERFHLWSGVVAGVDYLHNHNPILVHGDLKSANVLIDDNNNPQICDFGLVSILLEEGSSGMTTTSAYTGTDRYLAYELVRGGETVTPNTASDIFALGCIGLEFFFLQQPYAHRRNNMRGQIYIDIRAGIFPALRPQPFDPQNEGFRTILDQCWAHNPGDRTDSRALMACLPEMKKAITDEGGSPPSKSQIELYLLSPKSYQDQRIKDLRDLLDEQKQSIRQLRETNRLDEAEAQASRYKMTRDYIVMLMRERQARRLSEEDPATRAMHPEMSNSLPPENPQDETMEEVLENAMQTATSYAGRFISAATTSWPTGQTILMNNFHRALNVEFPLVPRG